MELIDPSFEVWGAVPLFCNDNMDDCMTIMANGGRICWQSEPKSPNDKPIDFIYRIMKKNHGAVIEMSNLVVRIDYINNEIDGLCMANSIDFLKISMGKYLNLFANDTSIFIGGNIRAWIDIINKNRVDKIPMDRFDFDDLEAMAVDWVNQIADEETAYICKDNVTIPPQLRRVAVKFIHDRGFTHELVRHRPCSFLQESQRYVRYDNGALIITPYPYRHGQPIPASFLNALECVFEEYKLQRETQPPQFARSILPNCTKTEILVCADYDEWNNVIFVLRSAPGSHPDMQEMMSDIKETVLAHFA